MFGEIGKAKVGKMNDRDLFVLGIGLYWAEGSKKNRDTRFVNSDPLMIKIWISWLIKFVGIDKKDLVLRVGINQSHRNRMEKVVSYWSRIVGVPSSQFRSPSLKKVSNQKIYANFEDHYGSLMVGVKRSTNLNYEVLGMIDAVGNFRG